MYNYITVSFYYSTLRKQLKVCSYNPVNSRLIGICINELSKESFFVIGNHCAIDTPISTHAVGHRYVYLMQIFGEKLTVAQLRG